MFQSVNTYTKLKARTTARKMELSVTMFFMCFIFLSGVHGVQRTVISTTKEFRYMYLDDYGIPAPGSIAITFQVQACHDAHLAVRTAEREPMEIVIGGRSNNESCIRMTIGGDCLSEYIGPVLSCYEYRSFTLNWGGKQIALSLGNSSLYYTKIILDLPLTFRLLNVGLGISTGYGSSGKWLFQGEREEAVESVDITTKTTTLTEIQIIRTTKIIIITVLVLVTLALITAAIGILLGLRYRRSKAYPTAKASGTAPTDSHYTMPREPEHDYAVITEYSTIVDYDYVNLPG